MTVSGSILAVDLGSTSLRVLIVDGAGSVTAAESSRYPTRRPEPRWAEQRPGDWVKAFNDAVGRLALSHPDRWRTIEAMAVTGHSPGVVLVSAGGVPVRDAIIWRDRRAVEEAEQLAAAASPEQWSEWTGFSTGWDAGLRPAKLRWLADHEPRSIEASRWLLQPKDFLIFHLTSNAVIDTTAMRGSGLSHLPGGLWDVVGFPVDRLPEPIAPSESAGTARPGVLPGGLEGIPVFPATFDGLCGILGSGPTVAGDAVNVAGTSQIVVLTTDRRVEVPGLGALKLSDGLYTLGGPTQSGAGSIAAAARQFGFRGWADLEEAASTAPSGSGGLVYLPFLDGERTPYWDAGLRGGLLGLGSDHGREHVARAVIEGVALAVADIIDRAVLTSAVSARVLLMSGGMSRSLLAASVRSDLLGVPVRRPRSAESSAVGAALFAAVGLGWHSDPVVAASAIVRTEVVAEPSGAEAGRALLARYRSVVNAARGLSLG